MVALYAVLYGLVGLAIGSFLNVVIDRAPARESLLGAPSHCPSCGRRLSAWELVPVFSYLRLRGRCRTCGVSIPRRVAWVELGTGLLFSFLWCLYGPTPQLVLHSVYSCLLLLVMVIDLEHKLILNVVILPAIAMAVLLVPLRQWIAPPLLSRGSFLWFVLNIGQPLGLSLAQAGILSQLMGGLVAFLIFLLIWLVSPQGMGEGDIKLAAFSGVVTAFPGAMVAVLGSFVLGGLVSAILLLLGKATRKTTIPFAPFLVITTFIVMLYGDTMSRWYLGY